MKQEFSRRRLIVLVLVALVSLAGLADLLPHTDDGCAVEVHCLACRVHLNKVGSVALASGVPASLHEVTIDHGDAAFVPLDAPAALRPPGRAPPLTA